MTVEIEDVATTHTDHMMPVTVSVMTEQAPLGLCETRG